MIKRFFDIIISAIGLVILSPLLLYIAILIKRDTSGPVFYRGPRMGKAGKVFGILKFRTMREEPASYAGPRVTAEDDVRVTPLGKWLRDSKLNELPQLWNVLVGEMSLVGPRPEDPSLLDIWPLNVREEILSVRPGITSPSSVLYRDEEKMLNSGHLMEVYMGEIQPSKLRLDQLYVRHHSILLDLDVIFWTLLVVLVPSLRDHKPPEGNLFLGPISRFVRRYVSWYFIDALTTFIAIGLVGAVERFFVAPLDLGLLKSILIALGYSVLFSSVASALGVQRISWATAAASEAYELLPPTFLAFISALTINYWFDFLPPRIILESAGLAFVGFIVTRYRLRLLTGLSSGWVDLRKNSLSVRERVIIVGTGDTGQFVAWRLKNYHEASNFHVIGFVDDDMFRQGLRMNGHPVLGHYEDIPKLVKKYDIGVIIFAIHKIPISEREAILNLCRSTRVRVIAWPDIVSLISTHSARPDVPATEEAQVLPPAQELLEREGMIRWLDVLESNLGKGDYTRAMEQLYAVRSVLQKVDPSEGKEA